VRLSRHADRRWTGLGFGAVAVLLAALWAGQPLVLAIGNYNLVVYFIALLVALIFIGVPIGFAFGIATLLYLVATTDVPLTVVANRIAEGMSDPILLAIPMFVFLGSLIAMSGMARALVELLIALVGHLRGGLSFVLLGGMYIVSGISGSKAADMAAISPVLLPEMERRGAQRPELVALLAASGAMSETIPPSIVLIAVGAVTGVSIKALFAAGFVPAAICALALMLIVLFRSRRTTEIPMERASGSRIAKALWIALPALALPVLIRYLVVNGITTATEVSVFGIAYAFVLGVLYRRLEWAKLYDAALAAASLSGAILLILGFATAMAWALTQSGFSDQLNTLFHQIAANRTTFLAISIVVFIVLGSFLEGIPAIVLLGPVMFPIAQSFGIDEVHYAIVVILAMGIGLFAPPFGVGFYFACAIGGASPDQVMRRIWSYLAFVLVGLVVVATVPWLSIGK
ncbi:MAG: TRAP transporter large permease, partial [Solimonas sp.]